MEEYDSLVNLGFSQNEAKVYITLLRNKRLNGYEIAKLSGVSRSLVYEVVNRLVGRGILIRLEGEPNYYIPLEYEKLIARIKKENEERISRAEEFLKGLADGEESRDYVLNIVGYDKFIKKAAVLIDSAEREISLSIWYSEFGLLREALENAVKRGIKIYIFTFEEIELDGAVIFSYRLTDASRLFPYRRLTLIVDGIQCLNGERGGSEDIYTYTKNHAVVSLAIDEIVLNIFCYKYMEKQGLISPGNTAEEFLGVIDKLAGEFGINGDMTKNFLVYDFQRRRNGESERH